VNYRELNALDEALGAQGLQILGFPCNQFGGQEPGTDAEIQKNAATPGAKTFARFPVLAKVDVNGATAAPIFQYLTKGAPGALGRQPILWNFAKFLVNKDGHVVHRYATTTNPSAMRADIEALMKQADE